MTGLLIFLIIGLIVIIAGLYNLGIKARKLEESDEDFLQNQLQLAKNECYHISEQFAHQLAIERRNYILKHKHNESGYEEWMTKGVETFFNTTVSPKLIDVQRECLIEYGAYPEIIDKVAALAQQETALA
jgi:hypothetical protein